MASIITQNIGTAAATGISPTPQQNAPSREQSTRQQSSTNEVQRAVSIQASKLVPGEVKGGDTKRSVTVPKRVEAGFSQNQSERAPREGESRESTTEGVPERKARAVA
jgi:hypothetical protein